jgi:hypothetical protein
MTVVYTGEQCGQDDLVVLDVLCEGCKKVVGKLTPSEVVMLAMQPYGVYCFECDPSETDMVPGHLLPSSTGDDVVVIRSEGGEPGSVIVWPASEKAPVAIGLSSSPFEHAVGVKAAQRGVNHDRC